MIHIRDAVVGDIEPTDIELKIIESQPMQKLRYVKQLGLDNLVYPGANHTRFEHSLGTMQITRELARSMFGKDDEVLEYAGLLHDVGHCAFSHLSDGLLARYLKTTHEKLGEELIKKGPLNDVLTENGVPIKKLLGYFNGVGNGIVVTGALGSDRLDYLMRDSHYTGVAYGIIDYQRVRTRLTIYKGKPAIYESGVQSAESILVARYSMFASVYNHHACRIAKSMYEKAVESAVDSGNLEPNELTTLDDEEMMHRLHSVKESRELAKRLRERSLYKRVYYDYVDDVDTEAIAREVEKTGVKKNDYVIEMIKFRGSTDNIDVVNKAGDYVGKLTEISPLVETLMTVLGTRKKLLVACDTSKSQKVKGAVLKAMKK